MVERYRPKRDNPDVGYGRPPVHTRFPPGKSGNPKGRPKGRRNLATDLAAELAERIVITEGGKRRKISKQQAVVKSLMVRALKADARAADMVLKLIERLQSGNEPDAIHPLPSEDRKIIEQFLSRYVSRQEGLVGPDPEEDPDGA